MTSLRSQLADVGSYTSQLQGQRAALLDSLTEIQRSFILDKSRYKLARCTRRSGKTHMDAAYLISECLSRANTPTLYAGLTRDSAKAAIWLLLLELLDRFGTAHQPQESQLRITFPNGSFIQLFGCDTENARNRLRGRKFKLIVFDETGFYSALDPLIYAVLPSLADLKGTLVLTSSPGELLQGFFYESDHGKFKDRWSRYFWTIHDNPLFQKPADDPKYKNRAEEELATVLEMQFNGKADHPGYQREWLGQWVNDHTALVYPATAATNLLVPAKMYGGEHAIGISISPFIYSAVVAKYSPYSRECHFVSAAEHDDLTIDAFAATITGLMDTYKSSMVVAHTGKYSKRIVTELKRRYKLPVIPMDDLDTSFHQAVFANDLRAGYIKIAKDLPLWDRYGKIVKGSNGDEVEGQPNFGPNAALALYRRIYQTTLQSYEPPQTEEDRHIDQLERSAFLSDDEIEDQQWYNQLPS